MKIKPATASRFDTIVQKLPYETFLVNEVFKDGIVNHFLKIVLSVEDLRFSNWFDFEKREMLLAESDSNHIVSFRGHKYLKTYTVLEEKPRNEHEKKFGRKYITINKGLFPGGLCYYIKKVYPRPQFLPTMYRVNFSNLTWTSNELAEAVINIDKTIKSSMIEISFHVENENLIAKLRINEHQTVRSNNKLL
jgi:hypothetical protein